MKRRVLLLPGSSNPGGSARYRGAYLIIENEARRRGLDYSAVCYPGVGSEDGLHSYQSAYASAAELCRKFKPHWIIARSTGCDVDGGLLSSSEKWIGDCDGCVLWGPALSETVVRIWPTEKERSAEIERYRQYKVFMSPDFFETLPAFEENIKGVRCDLRLARGSLDEINTLADLDALAEVHRRAQPRFRREVVEIADLKHTVIRSGTRPALLRKYFSCLFDTF